LFWLRIGTVGGSLLTQYWRILKKGLAIYSFWLEIQRSRFDSGSYQMFWEVVGPERSSLSLVSTTEELLGRNHSGFGLKSQEYGRGDHLRWLRNTLYPQKLALTSPTSSCRSVGIVRHGVCFCLFVNINYLTSRFLGVSLACLSRRMEIFRSTGVLSRNRKRDLWKWSSTLSTISEVRFLGFAHFQCSARCPWACTKFASILLWVWFIKPLPQPSFIVISRLTRKVCFSPLCYTSFPLLLLINHRLIWLSSSLPVPCFSYPSP
jgi:hypothetical protein